MNIKQCLYVPYTFNVAAIISYNLKWKYISEEKVKIGRNFAEKSRNFAEKNRINYMSHKKSSHKYHVA